MLGTGKQIQVFNELSNKKYRGLDLSKAQALTFFVSYDRKQTYVKIIVVQECDLVIRFDKKEQRSAFISDLQHWLERPDIGIKGMRMESGEKNLLKSAVTKEDRQQSLERFLRLAFAQVRT